MRASKRDWMFRVEVPGLEKNDVVFVVGNIPELGSWNHNQAIQLSTENIIVEEDDHSGSPEYQEVYGSSLDDFPENQCNKRQIFSQKISIDSDSDVQFRYFIAVICQSNGTKNSGKTLIIRKWETHMQPRLIRKNSPSNFTEDTIPDADKFGFQNGYSKIERGWLTDETAIQFKLFNNPIKLWKNRLQNRKVYIKMTPVNLVRHNSLELQQFSGDYEPVDTVDDSLSMDTQDIGDQPAISITEIAVMCEGEAHFKYQQQFGRPYNDDDFVIFNIAVRYPETVAYLVDYYVYTSKSYPGEPPSHIGFSYLLPSTLQSSVGLLTVPITSTKHRPIGQLTVEYVTIKPIMDFPWDMSISYAKHWEQRWSGLDVGHRGLGTSFKCETKNCANVRENTIASLKTAAHHGADMVEFDVQLSKDLIPVIYHDFHVSISLKRKKQIEAMDMLEIPVKDLTLEQLHLLKDFYYPADSLGKVLYVIGKEEQVLKRLVRFSVMKNSLHVADANKFSYINRIFISLHILLENLKSFLQQVYHLAEAREKNQRFFDEDLEDHQPFPTLQTVLQELDLHVGCNIEIKWTMQLKDGTFELNHPFDLNMYLDTILKVVLEHGGDRKIVFSCFNPDICSMMRLKQNKYPVVFLTQGVTAKYPTYHDPRCQTIPMAMRHALAADLLGINVHTEDILRDRSQVKLVKDAGLIIFCWGDDNNDKATIRDLKKLGLHAVIYDKIDEYNAKEVKESIFLVDARENQKALIALAQCNQSSAASTAASLTPFNSKESVDETKDSDSSSNSCPIAVSAKLTNDCDIQQDKEIRDLTKDFSVCAKTFGYSQKTKHHFDIICNKPSTLHDINVEDEAAKDCL